MGSVDVMAVDVTATVCAITGARAAPTLAQPIGNTLADSACSYHIPSLAPAVALPAPRHDRRRTGAAGSPPGGFPFLEADALPRLWWGHRGLDPDHSGGSLDSPLPLCYRTPPTRFRRSGSPGA